MKRIKEKKERALGTKLFLKAERCSSHKCATIRKPYPPGQHGQKRRRRISEFGRQLQEKQKIKITYGLTDRQMRNIFRQYAGQPDKIVEALETRLDRVVYLLGLAASSRIARQIISHGHIWVNGRKMTIPSYNVDKGDDISIRPQSKNLKVFEDLGIRLKKYEAPGWLELDQEKAEGKRVGTPKEDVILPFDVHLVGEFYTR